MNSPAAGTPLWHLFPVKSAYVESRSYVYHLKIASKLSYNAELAHHDAFLQWVQAADVHNLTTSVSKASLAEPKHTGSLRKQK